MIEFLAVFRQAIFETETKQIHFFHNHVAWVLYRHYFVLFSAENVSHMDFQQMNVIAHNISNPSFCLSR